MRIVCLPVGEIEANCYVLYDENRPDALVVDPGAEPEAVRIALSGRRIAAILLTHGHFDHIGAVAALRGGAAVYIHPGDAAMLENPNLSLANTAPNTPQRQGAPDGALPEGDYGLAGLAFSVLHTPGHTPGSVCLRFGDALLTGDTLFHNGYGRTDFPGGDFRVLTGSLRRLAKLDPALTIYPGHGQSGKLGEERWLMRCE